MWNRGREVVSRGSPDEGSISPCQRRRAWPLPRSPGLVSVGGTGGEREGEDAEGGGEK